MVISTVDICFSAHFKLDKWTCTEPELFEACVRRVDAAEKERISNQNAPQIEIRSLVREFRFRTMSFEELVAFNASHYKHFSNHEYRKILDMISSKKFQPELLNGVRKKRIDAVGFS